MKPEHFSSSECFCNSYLRQAHPQLFFIPQAPKLSFHKERVGSNIADLTREKLKTGDAQVVNNQFLFSLLLPFVFEPRSFLLAGDKAEKEKDTALFRAHSSSVQAPSLNAGCYSISLIRQVLTWCNMLFARQAECRLATITDWFGVEKT